MVRIKERYLLVNIIYPENSKSNVPSHVAHHQPTQEPVTPPSLLKAIKAEAMSLYGDYGLGAIGSDISVKYLSLATSTFIVRCARAHYQMLWSILTFMDRVPTKHGPGQPCIFRVVRVSGTIRKAEEEAIRQAKKLILAAKEEARLAKSSLTKAVYQKDDTVMNIRDYLSDEFMDEADG